LPLHVSVHIYDQLQGAHEQCFMLLLSWISNCTKHCSWAPWRWS